MSDYKNVAGGSGSFLSSTDDVNCETLEPWKQVSGPQIVSVERKGDFTVPEDDTKYAGIDMAEPGTDRTAVVVRRPGGAWCFLIQEDRLDWALARYMADHTDREYLQTSIEDEVCPGSDMRNWLVANSYYCDRLDDFLREWDDNLREMGRHRR